MIWTYLIFRDHRLYSEISFNGIQNSVLMLRAISMLITARIHQIMQILNDCGLKSTYHANCVLRSVSIEFLRDICERVTEAKAPSDFLSPEEPLNGTTSDEEIERQSAKRLE